MEYTKLGKTEIKVSRFCLGCMSLALVGVIAMNPVEIQAKQEREETIHNWLEEFGYSV